MPSYSKTFKRQMQQRMAQGEIKVADSFGGEEKTPSAKQCAPSAKQCVSPKTSMQALGRLKTRQMNKTELAYSRYLESLKMAGNVLWYEFEAVKLRLADNTFYTPDFMVMRSTGELECHETKGFMMDDANVKIKVAADSFPWPFFIVRKLNKGGLNWEITKVGNK